jgi:beta-glucosidase
MLKTHAGKTNEKKLIVTVRVTNTGKMDGEEVAQLYLSHIGNNIVKAPIKALKGFQRINLKAGESKILSFELTNEQISLVNDSGKTYLPKGMMTISVGGGQPDIKNKTTSNTVKTNINY